MKQSTLPHPGMSAKDVVEWSELSEGNKAHSYLFFIRQLICPKDLPELILFAIGWQGQKGYLPTVFS